MTDSLLSDEDVGLAQPTAPTTGTSPSILSDEDVGLGAAAPQASTMASVAAAPAIGFNQFLKSAVAAPGDLVGYGLSKLTGDQSYRGAGTRAASAEMGAVGVDPSSAQHQPRSQLEKVLQAGGEGAGAMLLPEAGLAGIGAAGVKIAPRIAEAADALFGSTSSPTRVVKNAVIGQTAAETGEAAAQQIGDDHPYWQTAARMGGSLIGGGVGFAATEAPALAGAAKNFVAPMTKAGQEGLAGQTLSDAMTNRAGTMDALDNAPQQLVPGSNPTTFQLTGDMGLGSLERVAATKDPASFNNLRAEQNQARVNALGDIQSTGTPEDVSAHLRSRLDSLDQQAGDIQATAGERAQTATTGLGGNQSPGYYGEAIRNEVMPQVQGATEGAAGQVNALGGTGTPEGYGTALREPFQQSTNALRVARNGLYKAVDPDNSLNIVATPLRDASAELYAGQSKLAAPPTGEEAAIQSTIQSLPDVIPFNDLTALDSRITAAKAAEMRAAGETPVWGRLTQLKNAVSGAIDNGVANQVAYERDAVANGAMKPTDTIESRLQQKVNDFYAERAGVASSGEGSSANPSTGARSASGVSGAGNQTRGRLPGAARDQGVPPPAPNFDPAAAQRLTAAKQANIAYQSQKKGPLGSIIKTDGFGRPLMSASSVPDAVFAKGPGGFEKAMAYRRAVNDDPAAISAMQNYAAATLRKTALNEDGTLNPAKFSSWLASHSDAMRAFPELAQRFASAARASEALNRFAPFRADMAPSQVPEMFFHAGPSGGEGVANLRRLVGDDRANSILQDYAAAKLKATATNPTDGTLDPGKIATFQKAHAEALKAFPQLNARFSTAAKAQQTVDAVAKARKAALDTYQAGAIGKVMNAAPEDVTKHIGAIFGSRDAGAQMGQLAREAASDKTGAAMAGLRKGIADFINSKFISNTEAGTSGANLVKSDAFQTFMNQSRPALAKVFKPDEIASMDAIAADLHRANRSITAVKLPGGSNTTQDTAALAKASHGKQEPLLREIVEGAVTGHVGLGPIGAVAGAGAAIGKHIAGAMRSAGYAKVDDLVKDALLNPALAKALLMKAPMRAGRGSDISLAQQLRRLSVFTAANQIPSRSASPQ